MIAAWKLANNMDEEHCKLGYSNTPYLSIAGDIMDGIYYMLDENTSTLEESIAYETLTNRKLTPEQCVDAIMNAYEIVQSDLSGNVLNAVKENADMIGISVSKMIKIILCEWALQRDMMANHMKKST